MNPYDICVISLDPTVGDEQRLAAKLGRLEPRIIKKVKAVIKEASSKTLGGVLS